jgi:formylmethanofuran dehydrogenase subunit E
MDLQTLLEQSSSRHNHLCPRQVLGVRMGLMALGILGLTGHDNHKKRLLAILESDGCFADGVEAATGCTVGHRTLRLEDYGKIAGTFVDTATCRAIRIAPALDLRERASGCIARETRHYFAQLLAYQLMPDDELLTMREVELNTPLEQILSRPGVRVNCELCGEEIINEREVRQSGLTLCRPCAQGGYYRLTHDTLFDMFPSTTWRIPIDRGGRGE